MALCVAHVRYIHHLASAGSDVDVLRNVLEKRGGSNRRIDWGTQGKNIPSVGRLLSRHSSAASDGHRHMALLPGMLPEYSTAHMFHHQGLMPSTGSSGRLSRGNMFVMHELHADKMTRSALCTGMREGFILSLPTTLFRTCAVTQDASLARGSFAQLGSHSGWPSAMAVGFPGGGTGP